MKSEQKTVGREQQEAEKQRQFELKQQKSNFGRFVKLFERDDNVWIDEINTRLETE